MKNSTLLQRLKADLEQLQLLVSIPSEPARFAPIGSLILERILYLKEFHLNSELNSEYDQLYLKWEQIYSTIVF